MKDEEETKSNQEEGLMGVEDDGWNKRRGEVEGLRVEGGGWKKEERKKRN